MPELGKQGLEVIENTHPLPSTPRHDFLCVHLFPCPFYLTCATVYLRARLDPEMQNFHHHHYMYFSSRQKVHKAVQLLQH